MTVIAYPFINVARAREDALIVRLPSGSTPRRFVCSDGYCINPRCDCEVIHLRLAEVTDLFKATLR